MKSRWTAILVPLAAGVSLLTAAGPAAADTSMISGTASDESCGAMNVITVQTPTRIQASVRPADVTSALYVQVLGSNGDVLPVAAQSAGFAASDVYAPGVYAVRVCRNSQYDGATVTYSGTITTSPAPPARVTVAGVEAVLRRVASGSGTIRTRSGLATFSVRASNTGPTTIRFDDNVHNVHVRDTNVLDALFSLNRVTIHSGGATFVLIDGVKQDRVMITAGNYKASGTVVRGGFRIA